MLRIKANYDKIPRSKKFKDYQDLLPKEKKMTAESMLFNGAILCMVMTLFGLAWGFLLLKIQGGEPE